MSRQTRLDVPGILHYIILRGIEKKRIFDDDLDRDGFGWANWLVWRFVREVGLPLAEIGRQLGVSTSAIAQILDGKQRG